MDEPRDAPAPTSEAALDVTGTPPAAHAGEADAEAPEPGLDAETEIDAEAELDAYHDELLAAEARAAIESDPGADAAFAETLDPAVFRFGEAVPVRPTCMWCTAALPVADAARCPTCGALLQPIDVDPDLPGLTTVSDNARAARVRLELAGRLATGDPALAPVGSDPDLVAIQSLRSPADLFGGHEPPESYAPPSAEVRSQMRRILWEAIEADPVGFVDPGPLSERRGDDELPI